MKATFLDDRGVVQVSGDDARKFLNGLFTTDVSKLHPGEARFGALLTPQGKIIVDFLVTQVPASNGGERFLLDVPRALAQARGGVGMWAGPGTQDAAAQCPLDRTMLSDLGTPPPAFDQEKPPPKAVSILRLLPARAPALRANR